MHLQKKIRRKKWQWKWGKWYKIVSISYLNKKLNIKLFPYPLWIEKILQDPIDHPMKISTISNSSFIWWLRALFILFIVLLPTYNLLLAQVTLRKKKNRLHLAFSFNKKDKYLIFLMKIPNFISNYIIMSW